MLRQRVFEFTKTNNGGFATLKVVFLRLNVYTVSLPLCSASVSLEGLAPRDTSAYLLLACTRTCSVGHSV